MRMQALALAIALCCTCFTTVLSACDRSGPGGCSFVFGNTCDWTHTSGWVVYNYFYYYLGLTGDHELTERVTSREACATENAVHCLKFQYRFEESDDLDLSVIVDDSEMGESEVWRLSRDDAASSSWDDARVPVNTSNAFRVIFEARSPGRHQRMFIDDIDYDKEACELHPSEAIPPPVTSTTSQSTTTTTTTTTTPSPPPPPTTTTVTTRFSPASSATRTSPDSALTTQSTARKPVPADASSNVGLIVGGVLAGVVLIAVGAVLCILFRRKPFHEWKTCCPQQKPPKEGFSMKAANNSTYNQDQNDSHQFIHADRNLVSPETGVQLPNSYNTATASTPADDYYSMVESPADGTDSERLDKDDLVNTSKQNDLKPQQPGLQYTDDSPYEIDDSHVVISSTRPALDDSYKKLNFHATDDGDRRDRILTSAEQADAYDHLTSSVTETPSSTYREDGPGQYQNAGVSKARNQQPRSVLYQNVPGVADTQQQRHRRGPEPFPEDQSDLSREDHQSAGANHLPKEATESSPEPFPDPAEVYELPMSETRDATGAVYHIVDEQALSELYPESSQTSPRDQSGQYQHLDFEGRRFNEANSDGVPLPTYSHLDQKPEGAYDEIDRNRRRKVIDGDYSHI